LFDYLKKKMKRGYHPKNIEQYVGMVAGMAVKHAAETSEVKRLKHVEEILQEEIEHWKDVVTRYEKDIIEPDEDNQRCADCSEYWKREDLNIVCCRDEPVCENCEDLSECKQCKEPKCRNDCLACCDVQGCFTRICEDCFEDNSTCIHRVCDVHCNPCILCPAQSRDNDE
jgi:hypothetical protein